MAKITTSTRVRRIGRQSLASRGATRARGQHKRLCEPAGAPDLALELHRPAAARYFVLRDREALSRSDITDSYLTIDGSGRPAIGIRFTPHGARALQRLTAEVARRGAMLSTPDVAVNQHFAVVLDGKLLSVVYVNHHVYRLGIQASEATDIGGGFSPTTADQLAKEIGAPPLPADLQILRATMITRRVIPGSDLPAGATTARHPSAGPA